MLSDSDLRERALPGSAGFVRRRPGPEGIAWIEIARPPVNVLRIAELDLLASAVQSRGDARVIVLSGQPFAFSAGVDVADHAPEEAAIDRMLTAMRAVLTGLVESPAVTIAAVRGACLGGAAEIVAACDLVIAAEDARIGFPEIRLACFPPAAPGLLPLRIGGGRSAEWILSGRIFSGREAREAGFVTRCVADEAVEPEAAVIASDLLSRAPAALAAAVGLVRRPRRRALSEELPIAEETYCGLAGDPDLVQAVRDFGRRKRGT